MPTRLQDNQRHRALTWPLFQRSVLKAGAFALLWWVLTGGDRTSWMVGVPTIIAATLISLKLHPISRWRWRLAGFARFVPFFLWQSLYGSIDVAMRAFHPRLPLDPLLLDYPLRLPDGPARVFLANTLSLLPGTLSAELRHDGVTVHALGGSPSTVSAAVRSLEVRVAHLFGVDLSPDDLTKGTHHE